mgnify:CR=1 FL=1
MKKNSTDSRKARAMLTVSQVLVYALLIFLSVLCLFSFYMLIVNASRTNADLQGGFKALPQGHFLENLKNAWNDSSINIPRGMLNSFVIAAATAILSTYFSALTAYGLHAYNFKLKRLAFLFIMAVMVIPKQVSAAGFVQLCYKLKLTNSYLPLILPGIAAPVVFFYMIQYMKSVLPMEIVEAARLAGLDEVPVIIKDVSDEQAAALALIENLQREDLNPIEVAEGCHQLIEKYGLTQETAAKKLGKSRSSVTNSLRLLALPQEVRHKVSEGILSAGHAKVLLGLPTQELMQQAAEEIEANGLNVRQTEALCKKLAKPAKPPKPKPDPFNRPKRAVEIEAALKEVTGSEVHVEYKDGKGSLKIDFYSDEMLQKFADLLGHYDPEAE